MGPISCIVETDKIDKIGKDVILHMGQKYE